MDKTLIEKAANVLWNAWKSGNVIAEIPEECRPHDRQSAYQIQQSVLALSGSTRIGWKIAATSKNGQKHIGVSGPLAGNLIANRAFNSGDSFDIGANIMGVAEAEFCFRLAKDLPPLETKYSVEAVLDAVDTLHPAIEIPDSRYRDFVTAGEYQLIADNACASWFVLGAPTTINWKEVDLKKHQVTASVNGSIAEHGVGSNVLGDPCTALQWIVNELSNTNIGLKSGEIITTGTCVVPFDITMGGNIEVDFGIFGSAKVVLK